MATHRSCAMIVCVCVSLSLSLSLALSLSLSISLCAPFFTLLPGQDAVIASLTGSGKTMAFLLPLLQKFVLPKHHNISAEPS